MKFLCHCTRWRSDDNRGGGLGGTGPCPAALRAYSYQSEFNPRSFIVRTEERKRIPPIDLEVPVAVQTATFGLG
jgi:hypothetical protein